MKKKIVFFSLFFYFLVIFQNSFLVHFTWQGIVPNLVLLVLILINLFEKQEGRLGIIAGFLAGFYLDVFYLGTAFFFGFFAAVSVLFSLFVKFVLRKYVQIPIIKKL